MMRKKLLLCFAIALLLGWTGTVRAQQGNVPVEVLQWAQTTESVRIFVHIRADVATLPDEASKQQAITAVMTNLLRDSLAGTKYRIVWIRLLSRNPVIAMEVGRDALAVLDGSPLVKAVRPWFPLPRGTVPVEMWQKAYQETLAGAKLIALLHTDVATTPEGALHQPAQRQAIADAQDKLVASLEGTEYRVTNRLTIMPVIGLSVDAESLAVVDRSPFVKWVVQDRPWPLPPLTKVPVSVWQKAEAKDVRIIVRLHTDVPTTPSGAWEQSVQRLAIAQAQDKLKAILRGTQHDVILRLTIIPVLDLQAGIDALIVLDRSPLVEWVLEDGYISPLYPTSKVHIGTWHRAETKKVVRLWVELTRDLPTRSSPLMPGQNIIAEAQDKLLASLAGTQYSVTTRPSNSLSIGLVVGLDALTLLDSSPLVEQIHDLDTPIRPTVPPSGP